MSDTTPHEGENPLSYPSRLRAAIEAVRQLQSFESGDAAYRPDLLEFAAQARRLADLAENAQMWVAEAFRLAQRAGWSAVGTHIDHPEIALEFDGRDEAGEPLWERPTSQVGARYAPCPYVGPATGEPCIMPAGHDDGIHDQVGDAGGPRRVASVTDIGAQSEGMRTACE